LYSCTPAFHQVGKAAYKPGLDRSMALDNVMGNPHRGYHTIHVAGTNGKGSVSHMLAAVLREAKYKVGLYTSPHLVDFCERIRVNGKKIPQQYVVDFVERHRLAIESMKPSFFELTSCLAFEFFRHKKVDIAIIEAGLGGRLDSTNIIRPKLSIITNISKEHTQYLGDTLIQIAGEKAGIIKAHVPVVIGEAVNQPDVCDVFLNKADEMQSSVFFAEEEQRLLNVRQHKSGKTEFHSPEFGRFFCDLDGQVQRMNVQTVLTALHQLKEVRIKVPPKAVRGGMARIVELTGLTGRWQTLQKEPLVICDTGHNAGAWEHLTPQLLQKAASHTHLRMVIGMSNDKDIDTILPMMPPDAMYYLTQASTGRALPVETLETKARQYGLSGKSYLSVNDAVEAVMKEALPQDLIFIGGSNFIVADALPLYSDGQFREENLKIADPDDSEPETET
jgi:dihydrofolate synthase/folylpolyglutamate synthase